MDGHSRIRSWSEGSYTNEQEAQPFTAAKAEQRSPQRRMLWSRPGCVQSFASMMPSALNRVCAHPILISWILGASILNAIVLTVPFNGVRLVSIASEWQGWAFLILAVVAATGLGYFLGMFTCWPWIRPICSRLNGAPFMCGDHVVILAGPLRGRCAVVEDITKGQGGWDIVWLDLGPERRKTFSNIFEEYSMLKCRKGEQDGAPNSRPPSQLPASPEIRSPDSLRTSSSGGCG